MDMASSTSDSTTGSMSSLMGVLFTSTTTPLYSLQWAPSTTGQYAGTCLFNIVLSVILRALFSYRAILEHRLREIERRRREIIVSGKKQDDNGAGNRSGGKYRPWRASMDVPKALLDTVIAGVGYLLSVRSHSI